MGVACVDRAGVYTMSYSNTVKMVPFSPRYVDYYTKCFTSHANILEGAYRASKTTCNILSFAAHLETCYDKIHLVSGYSSTTARMNVSDGNGIGLSHIFRGRCKAGKYEGNECLRIKTKRGEKIVVFVGGGQSDSYKKIQGLSFGYWLTVEAANLFISDDEKCFIDMALSRLTQSHDPKFWWDFNPVYPAHSIYKKYIDKWHTQAESGEFYGGYNYMKCSLFDNTALTESQRMSFLSKYPDHESMEYQRYILGNRACAEGLIFGQFAKNKERWIVNDLQAVINDANRGRKFVSIGVDFGGNGSDTAFVASLIYNNYHNICVLASDKLDMSGGDKTSRDFRESFKSFLQKVIGLGVAPVLYAFGDCADTVMVNEMRQVTKELGIYGKPEICNSQKHTIKKRIDAKKTLMAVGHWSVYKDAESVISSTELQVWDSRKGHEDERLDNGTVDIDTSDAEEYSWSAFLDDLLYYCG